MRLLGEKALRPRNKVRSPRLILTEAGVAKSMTPMMTISCDIFHFNIIIFYYTYYRVS